MATPVETYEEIEKTVLHLPHPDRSKLVTKLLESLDEGVELSDEWRDELEHRVNEIDEGKATLISHEDVMASARAKVEEIQQGKQG